MRNQFAKRTENGCLQTCLGSILVGINLLALPATAQVNNSVAYTWTTLAGFPGLGSADGVGNAAQFDQPFSVAVDPHGNIFVADSANYTIRKITAAGVVTTIAGLAGVPGDSD